MNMRNGRPPCRNLNHGRMNVAINFCPECGERFDSRAKASCSTQKHGDFRKQRFAFCMDCGAKLAVK